ncbi:MAG: hypothetical protein HQ528_05525 [Candidatus Marinimicrobia bacterium]|nr:hypothetical protein [Candidatus Neomarinimicrobiota bacterium]
MIGRYYLAVVILLTASISFLPAQFHEFDLDQIDSADYYTTPNSVIRGIGISLGHQPLFSNDPIARMKLGLTISRPFYSLISTDNNKIVGVLPKFDFGFLVTANLIIRGSLAAYSVGNDITRITAYGGTLFLNSTDDKPPWTINILLSQLNGPADIALRSTDILFRRKYQLAGIPFFLGFGADFYNGRATPDILSAKRFSGQTNYFYISEQFKVGNLFSVGVHCRYHQEIVLLTIDLTRELK